MTATQPARIVLSLIGFNREHHGNVNARIREFRAPAPVAFVVAKGTDDGRR